MAFEQLKSEISMLLTEMENQPADQWELHEMILEKLNELRTHGLPLPQDLVSLEEGLCATIVRCCTSDVNSAGLFTPVPISRSTGTLPRKSGVSFA